VFGLHAHGFPVQCRLILMDALGRASGSRAGSEWTLPLRNVSEDKVWGR
jgi:hypothetical protein